MGHVCRLIDEESKELDRVEREISAQKQRLRDLEIALQKKMQQEQLYNTTIKETETAYGKIVSSASALHNVMRSDAGNIGQPLKPVERRSGLYANREDAGSR